MIQTGSVPKKFGKSVVILITKCDKKFVDDVTYYHSTTIIPILAKVFKAY